MVYYLVLTSRVAGGVVSSKNDNFCHEKDDVLYGFLQSVI